MSFCEYESKVIRALRSDDLSDELREHIDGCPECRLTLQLVLDMKELAQVTAANERSAKARVLWILARENRSRKALVRLSFFAKLAVLIVLAAPIVWGLLLSRFGQMQVLDEAASLPIFTVLSMSIGLVLYWLAGHAYVAKESDAWSSLRVRG